MKTNQQQVCHSERSEESLSLNRRAAPVADYDGGVDSLRRLLVKSREKDAVFQQIAGDREVVLTRYQRVFSSKAIKKLDEVTFRSFLTFENNRHWNGLHRQGPRICADMNRLREVLAALLDEHKPIRARMDASVDAVPGMGKAIITGILLVAYPDRYGVWNNTSEAALRTLKLWPEFERGTSFGEKYAAINQLLNQLAKELTVDLWTLDALFWRVVDSESVETASSKAGDESLETQRFGLERHLHEFLRDNWEKTELGRDWVLHSEKGEPEAGYEYPTDVGRIDLLAKHKRGKRWLIVELKRGQTADDTVGQVLRYMGWVQKNLVDKGETVEGLIIAHETDAKLTYALSAVTNVRLLLYEVSFKLVGAKA